MAMNFKLTYLVILLIILFSGILILSYLVLSIKNFGIQLGIVGVGVTIIVAIMIFMIQTWMFQQVTKMTSEYTNRRRNRIRSFKDGTIKQLNRVKEMDKEFLSLMTEYRNNPSMKNREKVNRYADRELTKNTVNLSKFLIQKHLDYSKDYINKIEIITTLSTTLYDLGDEFSEIQYVDFDAFEKNTIPSIDFIKVNPIMSISTEFLDHISGVEFKIKEIDDLILLIQSEPE